MKKLHELGKLEETYRVQKQITAPDDTEILKRFMSHHILLQAVKGERCNQFMFLLWISCNCSQVFCFL